MTETANATNDIAKKEKDIVAKIEPMEKTVKFSILSLWIAWMSKRYESIIQATRLLLREYGVRKSGAAIRMQSILHINM